MNRPTALPCPKCGALLSEEAAGGLCPGCLVALTLDADDPDSAPAPEPIAFGDYHLLEEIGRGGMGVVFRARQLSANRLVAVKTIPAGKLASPAEIQRFRSEAAAAAQLDHPNIIPIYEIGQCDGRHFFSMKLIEGPSLAQSIDDGRFAPRPAGGGAEISRQRTAARLVADVAKAVQHAHDRGVLHRDLKPGNILLDARQEPHLTDFGLAKVVEADTDLTRTAAVLGTLEYMSPEQARGKSRQSTIAADLYSLGVVLYELLTGSTPFRGREPLEVIRRAIEEEPLPLRRAVPAIDSDLETICLKCLEKSPGARYASALELAQELERWLADEPIRARPSGPWERALKFARRKPRATVVAAIIGVGVLALTWLAFVAAQQKTTVTSARAEMARTTGLLKVQQARDWFETENSHGALARLAQTVREDPANTAAVARLLAALTQRPFALPAVRFTHTQEVQAAVFSPDGRRILTGCNDGVARLWDTASGSLLVAFPTSDGPVLDTAFAPDSRRVATAARNGNARLFDAATGRQLSALPHSSLVRFIAFTPDGRQLLTLSTNLALLWNLDSLTVKTQHLDGPRGRVAQFSPGGDRVVVGSDAGSVWIGSRSAFGSLDHFAGHRSAVRCLAISPDGRHLASGGDDGQILVRALAAATTIRTTFLHAGPVVTLEFDPAGQRLASASEDGTARIWSLDPTGPGVEPLRHSGQVQVARFNASGDLVLTASDDGTARLWRSLDGQPASEPIRHPSFVDAARFGPDGRHFATVCSDHSVRLWHLPRQQLPDFPLARGERPAQFDYTPSGEFAVTVSNEVIRIWNLRSGEPAGRPHRRPAISTARIAPDGGSVLELTTNGSWLFVAGSEMEQRLSSDSAQFGGFSADGRRVMAGSTNQLRVWERPDLHVLATINSPEPIQDSFLSDDGTRIVGVSGETVWIWDIERKSSSPASFAHPVPVGSVAVEPRRDGRMAVLAGSVAYVWNAPQRKAMQLTHSAPVRAAQFSPDGRWLITASGPAAQIWDLAIGTLQFTLPHRSEVNSVSFSPDGRRIVTASVDHSIQAWEADGGHVLTDPIMIGVPTWDARFTTCGRWLTARTEGSPVFWEVPGTPGPAPTWLPDLAEAVAELHWENTQSPTSVAPDALARLTTLLGADHGEGMGSYERWARWFLNVDPGRAASPSAHRPAHPAAE